MAFTTSAIVCQIKMILLNLLLVVNILGAFVIALPTITYPLNSQLPPVARPSVLYQYTFPSSTFSSTLPLTYSLSSGPSWLSLDSQTRILSGTPSSSDAGPDTVTGISISITASDTTGSATLNATFVISKNPAPVVNIPPSAQLQSTGVFSAPDTLLYHPSTPFNFTFQPDTFLVNGTGSTLSYYAVTTDNTPLPSWITFDGESLFFSGQTPEYQSLIQPPQTFGLQLVASDVQGFTGASLSFSIKVGVHLFAFTNQYLTANASVGSAFNFSGLAENLKLDGKPAQSPYISSVTAETPSWLAFDNSTLELSGNVSTDAIPYNVTVLAQDVYGDTTNTTVYIDVISSIFDSLIGTLNATIGSSFSFDLSAYLRQKSDVEMAIQFPSSISWLSYNAQNFILSGQVPTSTKPSLINITASATSKSSRMTSSQSFNLSVISSATQSSTSTATQSAIPSASQTSQGSPRKNLILAITIPVVLLFVSLLFALFCYCRRRRRAKRYPYPSVKSIISAPMEATSSVLEIEKPVYVTPPKPLELDMSGFSDHGLPLRNSAPATPSPAAKRPLKRSYSMSATPDASLSRTTESDILGMRSRAYSDNALSKTETSWRSTQGSSDIIGDVSASGTSSSKSRNTNLYRLTGEYSNYSRKGHRRRSALTLSQNPTDIMTEAQSRSQARKRETSVLSFGAGDFEVRKSGIENYSVMNRPRPSKRTDDLEHPNIYPRRGSKRQSSFMSGLGRTRSGIGHGGRESISSTSRISKRRSVGHGQDWTPGRSLTRDLSAGLTIASGETGEQRRSEASLLSRYSADLKADAFPRAAIRPVAKSPSIFDTSSRSIRSRNSRPVSRRTNESPFFAASSSSRVSRRSTRRMTMTRTSYADSPTVPEDIIMPTLEERIMRSLREESVDGGTVTPAGETPINRTPMSGALARIHGGGDDFGISYGRAREGTRQLRTYIQDRLDRPKTMGSLKSLGSQDSRFESVSEFSRYPSRSPERNAMEDSYQDYIDEDEDEDEEANWETYETRDELGNLIGYGGEEPELKTASTRSTVKANLMAGPVRNSSNTESPIMDISPNVRMIAGRGRRPESMEARYRKESSIAIVDRGETPEVDWQAYI